MERAPCGNAAKRGESLRGICRRWRRVGAGLVLVFGLPLTIAGGALGAEPSRPTPEQLKLGLELFTREWKPNDPRCHGGDGLGPVYNETSCVACHGQGGPGGAGPGAMNVDLISLLGGDIRDVRGNIRAVEWSHAPSVIPVAVDIPGISLPFKETHHQWSR